MLSLKTPPDKTKRGTRGRLVVLGILLAACVLASLGNHAIAKHYRIGGGSGDSIGTYRRIGPDDGGQVFCGGSSLMQMGIDWRAVSEHFGRGVENWGVAGSSPEEWEQSQLVAVGTDVTIIGVSSYDLNEYHLCDNRAAVVPFRQTVAAILRHRPDTDLTKRILGQYPLNLVRKAFPTAGRSDAVLVGIRADMRRVATLVNRGDGSRPNDGADDEEVTIEFNDRGVSSMPLLEFRTSDARVSDWSPARKQRRFVVMRSHIEGKHVFGGMKTAALGRMLERAEAAGVVYLVVLPVSPSYKQEFFGEHEARGFDAALESASAAAPSVRVIRLDREARLASDDLFSDSVHLNAEGKELATALFLRELSRIAETP